MAISNHDLQLLDSTTRKVVLDALTNPDFLKVVTPNYGAGFLGTGEEPVKLTGTVNGIKIVEHRLDIQGLACKGDAQGDAIGLAAGGAAYFDQYTVAEYGYVYRIEMICLETPTEATATFEQDIDLMAEDDNDVAYDGAVDDTVIAAARDWVVGEMAVDNTPKLTANDYFYLGEGDTGATTGVYGAGKFVIRFYGHPGF